MPVITAVAGWYRNLSRLAKVIGFLAAISAFVVSTAAAWDILEPYWYVSRGMLRQVVDKQAVAVDRQSIIILKGQLNEAVRDPAAKSSPIVKERIEEITREIDDTSRRIKRSIGTIQ